MSVGLRTEGFPQRSLARPGMRTNGRELEQGGATASTTSAAATATSVAPSRGLSSKRTRGSGELLAVISGERISFPSGSVTALVTEALRLRSSSHISLILLDRILIYTFGVGQDLTAGTSY